MPDILAIMAISLPVMYFTDRRGVISPFRMRVLNGFEIERVGSAMEPMVIDWNEDVAVDCLSKCKEVFEIQSAVLSR